jgi:hypothetical protein
MQPPGCTGTAPVWKSHPDPANHAAAAAAVGIVEVVAVVVVAGAAAIAAAAVLCQSSCAKFVL